MPKEKVEKILVYNEQDVVNLFYILLSWKKILVNLEDSESKESKN